MAVFLILFTIVLIFIGYKLYQSSKLNLPPGPSPWPIIGNFHNLKPVRFRCFADLSQAYGPIISVWSGSTLNVIVSSSKLAKEVLKDNDQQLADRPKLTKDVTGLIWADYGPNYVKLKKVCALYFFSPKGLETLRPIRESEVMAMVQSIFKDCTIPENYGKCLILRKYLGSMAFNTITRLVLGKRFVSKEGVMDKQGVELLAIFSDKVKLGTTFELAEHIPWLKWMIWPKKAAHFELEGRRDWLIRAVMEEHKLAAKRDGGGAKHHFVDALLSLNDKYEISEGNKIGLLWDLITAGMDTSAITVEWAMAQLIKNPRVQKKVQEELDRVIGPNRGISETDFSSLPYLHCVAKEALRLHPPTPLMLPHRANASTKIGGYDIPKGTNVHVNVWAIARDPAVWQDPLEFRPERFIEEDVDLKGHDFRLLPFGAGRRMCPAAQLGVNMVLLTLGNLLHHFCWTTFEGVKPKEIDMSESPGLVTFMGTPLQATPTLRLPAKYYKHVDI